MTMMDFNDAPEQREYGSGPIPPDSAVKVRLTLRQPKQEFAALDDPRIFQAKSGLRGLDCEFEVLSASFAGKKIWETLWLPPAMQIMSLTQGQQGACEGSVAKMRAILEAARGISSKDQSPAARQARTMRDWGDLHGLEFGIIVGVKKVEPGDKYVNNQIKRVLTPDNEEYRHVMGGGEIITDKPVPEIPQAAAPAASPKPAWGTQPAPPPAAQQTAPPQQGQLPQQQPAARPAWGTQPAPPPAAAAPQGPPPQYDRVPF